MSTRMPPVTHRDIVRLHVINDRHVYVPNPARPARLAKGIVVETALFHQLVEVVAAVEEDESVFAHCCFGFRVLQMRCGLVRIVSGCCGAVERWVRR